MVQRWNWEERPQEKGPPVSFLYLIGPLFGDFQPGSLLQLHSAIPYEMITDGMWCGGLSWPAFLAGKPVHRHKLYIENVKDFGAFPRRKREWIKSKHLKRTYNFWYYSKCAYCTHKKGKNWFLYKFPTCSVLKAHSNILAKCMDFFS